jgi:hypothetical protein
MANAFLTFLVAMKSKVKTLASSVSGSKMVLWRHVLLMGGILCPHMVEVGANLL